MIVTQLSQMGMGVADAIMAGRVSAADLAGVALGGNLFWPLMLFMSGVIMALTPAVSQLHGARREAEVAAVVRQALWLALVGGGITFLLLGYAEAVLVFVGVDPAAIPVAVDYIARCDGACRRCSAISRCAICAKACRGRRRRWPSR